MKKVNYNLYLVVILAMLIMLLLLNCTTSKPLKRGLNREQRWTNRQQHKYSPYRCGVAGSVNKPIQ